MKNILNKCRAKNVNLYSEDELFYDKDNPDNLLSIIGKFNKEINEISNRLIEKYEKLNTSVLDIYYLGKDVYTEQLKNLSNDFKEISNDLNNYKSGFLEKVKYYIKVAKGCGYILVLVYLSILSLISFFGCILLLAYSYMTNQGNLGTFMHIVWNSIKFFSFSFLMYAAAFGMLYNGLRDLIAYNMFLFGNNLNSTETYLFTNNKSKEFLYFCMNEENADFTGDLEYILYDDLDEVLTNYGQLNYLLHKDYKSLKETNIISEYIVVPDNNSDIHSAYEENQKNEEELYITLPIKNITESIKKLNENFNKFSEISNINENNNIKGSFSISLNCGFLKNDLNMLYNSLYDLSVQSRILFVLSCCIGFFGEALIYFYLLSIYHYNNDEFKEGNLKMNRTKNSRNPRINFDLSSKNEFLDKSKPNNMKKFNQKLDNISSFE